MKISSYQVFRSAACPIWGAGTSQPVGWLFAQDGHGIPHLAGNPASGLGHCFTVDHKRLAASSCEWWQTWLRMPSRSLLTWPLNLLTHAQQPCGLEIEW